ncbi:heparinase II/III family protein [candidate division KSB1 bacterium]|nr:heparinase II/III family protein [candidate division KSB1 bacterium]
MEKPALNKQTYFHEIEKSVQKFWDGYPAFIDQWKRSQQQTNPWGVNPPGMPAYLAGALTFLYEETGERAHAENIAVILKDFAELPQYYPKAATEKFIQYEHGVPAILDLFSAGPLLRAYLAVRDAEILDTDSKEAIDNCIAASADFIFYFPEWGTHNRAILRAETLALAALAVPQHAHAQRWQKMATYIGSDSLTGWEIEDTTGYSPIWLLALFRHAMDTGQTALFDSPIIKYYMQYYYKLTTPLGMIPDFGDTDWRATLYQLRFVAIFEKAAAIYKDPCLRWAAQVYYENEKQRTDIFDVSTAEVLCSAYRWMDESLTPRQPDSLSQDVLEEIIGKKIVFRNGWNRDSTYLLLNYRDEGDGGWIHREYLRRTLSVEEEKMTHGHADENSIALLMNAGSVLLTDAGYRDNLPSGQYGAFRADYFHNRIVARKNKRDAKQSMLEFVHNTGAYRRVNTTKIDFLTLQDVDMSRTRLVDEELGYQWDRSVSYVKNKSLFVIVDSLQVLRPDYFTFTNFWHAQQIKAAGNHCYELLYDSISSRGTTFELNQNQSLNVKFLDIESKSEGIESIRRQYQDEFALYQTITSQYKAGDFELFITLLIPHDREKKIDDIAPAIRVINSSKPYQAVGVEFKDQNETTFLCVKLNLDMDIARENIRPRYQYALGKVTYDDFETDASYLYATISDNRVKFSASNVLKVLYRGKPLMEALPNSFPLQPDGNPDRVSYAKWRCWEDSLNL